ncbi:TetR/AcrR family transcriptional regulator [Dactylosporangium sp. NPDC048998]|uniref:TetR/AcrR family transcriptional regulator n=1 Tax=Dactylosporangium sp. NPDC048998 TaxID=3363976 RepID=UPI0037169C9F
MSTTTKRLGTEEERRAAILDAAWRLIAERGIHAVRVADIAKVCQTSAANVYNYFPDKNDVLTAALRHCVARSFDRQDAELRRIDNGYERMLKLIDMVVPRIGERRDEWSIWLQYWTEVSLHPEYRPVHNEFYERWRDTVVRIMRRGQRQGVFRDDVDATRVSMQLTAMIDGLGVQVLTGVRGMTATTMRDLLVDYVDRELLP